MTDERRRDERAESFEIIRVTAKDPQGRELVFPIMVRDRSQYGVGGVYGRQSFESWYRLLAGGFGWSRKHHADSLDHARGKSCIRTWFSHCLMIRDCAAHHFVADECEPGTPGAVTRGLPIGEGHLFRGSHLAR